MSQKDTQFAGFAKAVLIRMLEQREWLGMDFNRDDREEVEEYSAIIARAAYDLVQHTLLNVEHINLDRLAIAEHVARIPDMAALLEEKGE